MDRIIFKSVLPVCLILAFVAPAYPYSGGSGTSDDPWQIATLADLQAMAAAPADWDKDFILTADLDLSSLSLSAALIAPDTDPDTSDFQGTPFTGGFDGNFRTLSNLTIVDSTGADCLGLFGQIRAGGQVRNLILENASITTYGYQRVNIGLLAGYAINAEISQCGVVGNIEVIGDDYNFTGNIGGLIGLLYSSTITQSYSSANVLGGFIGVGGLVGVSGNSTLSDCYASGSVKGENYVGGLIGTIFQGIVIDRCYSVGPVFCDSGGGLIAQSDALTPVTNSFWDVLTSNQWTSAGGTGLYTGDMQNRWVYENAGWDFADETIDGTPAVWKMNPDSYPLLAWQKTSQGKYSGGTGTEADPWQIATLDDLKVMAATATDWDKYFILTADLDLSGLSLSTALIAPDTDPATPDFQGIPFIGSFDGNFHVLSNLVIADSTGADFLGLFGQIGFNGQVRNLILTNATVLGPGYQYEDIGLLTGSSIGGIIIACSVSGEISLNGIADNTRVGGLVGWQQFGMVIQCCSMASVSGGYSVSGGLVGLLEYGSIFDSYASGPTTGHFNIGGLVGRNSSGTIDRCYSVGPVNCTTGGGLVGSALSGTTTNSFWDVWKSLQATSAGGTGLISWEMFNRQTFENAGWNFRGTPPVWIIRDGQDYPKLAAFKYGTGGGTPENPYTIDSVEEFLLLSGSPDDWGKSFILTTDLDLSGHVFDRAPIAPDNSPDHNGSYVGVDFAGTFDGNGHTISNLTIRTENGGDYLGLFGWADNATIRNLRMDNVSITAFGENLNVGAIVGVLYNSQLSLCVVSGTITTADSSWFVGGLVGNQDSGGIESCAARVNITSGDRSIFYGGMVGGMNSGTISHAFAAGTIHCGQRAGNVGGLIGSLSSDSIIENSCAQGSISVGTDCSEVAGLVGQLFGQVRYSYSTTSLRCSGTGWLAGLANGGAGGTAINSFWDIEASGFPWKNGYGTGLTTAQMVLKSTFTAAGWDFDDTSIDGDPADWRIRDGQDYPRLVWQPILPGDIAGDPSVDLADLMAVADEWMEACSGCAADVNGDGIVNLLDFCILGISWMAQP